MRVPGTATGPAALIRPPTADRQGRVGAPKAITATAHKLARVVYHLMRYGEAYVKRTEQAYAQEVRGRLEKQLARRAKEMGYELKKIEPDVPVS